MNEKKGFSMKDLLEIVVEMGGAKLTLEIVEAILPKPISLVNKGTALIIGSAIGNFAFHNQTDPYYDEIEKLLADIKEKAAKAKSESDRS